MSNAPTPVLPLLVVDDEADVRDTLAGQLKWEGYEVATAASAAEALDQLASRRFSVIISDQRMPEMSGLDFLAKAKALQPHVSTVLITGALSLNTVIDAINKGEIFRFLAKPWVQAELVATVKNAVQRFELVEHNARLLEDTASLNAQLARANAELRAQLDTVTAQKAEIDSANSALQTNFDRSLELCQRIINTFYPLLAQHTEAVVQICRRMAETAHFSENEKHVLLTSAWLHDIGLLGCQRELVHKFYTFPAGLAAHERDLIERHPIQGQMLASFVDQLADVGATIRAHHERFDGAGYPDKLRGESIPWTARCLAVAVFFVESGLPKDEAAEAIVKGSGQAFDPEAVRLFFKATRSAELPRQVREVLLAELVPGMRLSKSLYLANGLLLFPEDQLLGEATIAKIRNHDLHTSVTQRLLVYR
jgi:response regulator RpfG family c-di-GMP phosphodiesterase